LTGEGWALAGAALLLVGTLFAAIFGRRNSRDSTDLARIELLFTEYKDIIDGLKKDVEKLQSDMAGLKREKEDEKRESDRRIHALRAYVGDLLDFIARTTGATPPSPREPLD
jgi:molecular chaperone GrpE (heat shock protein)